MGLVFLRHAYSRYSAVKFDFGETMHTIHTELEELNEQAGDLAKKIKENFRKLGI